jgi:arsenite methyltransferase
MKELQSDEIKKAVRDRYGDIAKAGPSGAGCCAPNSCCGAPSNNRGYEAPRQSCADPAVKTAPEASNLGLGCGNPHALAALKPGETVLDLGCGAGFDAFSAAAQVGENGRVIGVDMTPEMIFKARELAAAEAYSNVEFRLGEIESLPVADSSVDVIISNCVINLAPDKRKVFNDAYRVLKHGGRLAISDTVAIREMPKEVRKNLELYSSCIAGALEMNELEAILKEAGFRDIEIKANRTWSESINEWAEGLNAAKYIASAEIKAVKPAM